VHNHTGTVLDAWGLKRSFGLTDAVRDLDISVRPAEIVAVVGPPGCGKSTLLGLLSGQLDCDEGHVLFKGEEVTHLPLLRRAELGLVRAVDLVSLFDELTIADHVLAVARNSAPTINELYAQWQVDSRYLKLGLRSLGTAGLDVPAATPVGELSVVQRRQLAFGLAAIAPFDLLLWDEPFDGIGAADRRGLVYLLQAQKADQRSILFSGSDADLAAGIADRVLLMSQGGITGG